MNAPVIVWTMHDGDFAFTRLKVHLLLIDRYFAIGTEWPDEPVGWYTRGFTNAEEAHAFAVNHTRLLELSGDSMQRGPYLAEVNEERADLSGLVELDEPNGDLTELFTVAMIVAVA